MSRTEWHGEPHSTRTAAARSGRRPEPGGKRSMSDAPGKPPIVDALGTKIVEQGSIAR